MAALHYRVDDAEVHLELDRTLTIGRGSGNDLVIRGASGVSRRHAEIRREGSTYVVTDVRSRNGTRIERAGSSIEVEGATALEPGDTIVLGELRISFDAPAPDARDADATDAAVRSPTYIPAVTRVDADRRGPPTALPPAPTTSAESEGGPSWLPIVGGAIAAGAAAATAVVLIARVL